MGMALFVNYILFSIIASVWPPFVDGTELMPLHRPEHAQAERAAGSHDSTLPIGIFRS
jgi:hypothetical protein